MTEAPRPSWLFHLTLACAAMACVLLAATSMVHRPLPNALPSALHAARIAGDGAFRFESVRRVLPMNHDAPIDRASTRLAPTARAAWQRSTGRRTQRTASSQISGVERTTGLIARSAYARSRGLPSVAHFDVHRRVGRLGAAPTRAPPHHR
ncbi:hypothetical protein [Gemmatimonas groenlandica]|uniref:Uncharacterized protein n=1 Tax=Gemmatimonas groenlandica TaxID=2732249 RepID=A0A6M4ILC8_9BACT|nr:hypothetical protein [Gemmatimonas groenlandica]QJR34337.1 hypothetical protein HKW67_01760 [Gemmatimonas groenlandica]